uniref:Uncharacterized protein n=1 Tax=Rhizophora mucronata TaxID=61149 RepID=A0A2P2J8M3_RHIMU
MLLPKPTPPVPSPSSTQHQKQKQKPPFRQISEFTTSVLVTTQLFFLAILLFCLSIESRFSKFAKSSPHPSNQEKDSHWA